MDDEHPNAERIAEIRFGIFRIRVGFPTRFRLKFESEKVSAFFAPCNAFHEFSIAELTPPLNCTNR